jgi:hypothetical protein
MKKPKRKVTYTGDLATPITVEFPLRVPTLPLDDPMAQIIAPPAKPELEEYNRRLEAACEAFGKKINHKLKLLLEHYQISDVNPWRRLALALAFDHVPGFKNESGKAKRRPKVWTPMKLTMLVATIDHVKSELSLNARQACEYIADNEDYCQKWGPPKTGKGTKKQWVETLESRYHDGRKLSDDDFLAEYLRRYS